MEETIKNLRLDHAATYRIQVQGRVRDGLADWLQEVSVRMDRLSGGPTITTLTGTVQDQAGLHGLLNRIRDLNIPLLSVRLIDPQILDAKE